jgi:hypothetical protein
MRNMLRCRRGTVAFATVIALVPLIGVVALGAEAASWYVTRQHAQNAADSAAYSGGLWLACSLASPCADPSSETLDYRGKEFAAQNSFCNSGDTSYPGSKCVASLPSGISQSVTITQLAAWNGVSGNFVQAVVGQTQPPYLAGVLGLPRVNISATAIAQVVKLANPCILALKDSISFQGSPTVSAPNCGLASNSNLTNSISFTGNNGINVSNVGSISGGGGCSQTGGTQCSNVFKFAPPTPDPLSTLNSAMSNLSTANFSGPCGSNSTPTAYSATPAAQQCYNLMGNGNGNTFKFGNQIYNLNGVYFFSGNVTIGGNTTLQLACSPPSSTCGATLILLPGSTLTINGNPTIQLTALSSVSTSQVPAALSSKLGVSNGVVNLMSKLLLYDPETSSNVKITGSSTSFFNGITYAPNADVIYQGNTSQNYDCVEVIAKGVQLLGNSTLNNTGCPTNEQPHSQFVRLVRGS